MVHLLEQVIRVGHSEAVQDRGHIRRFFLVDQAGVGEPGREGVVEVRRADVHLLPAVAQPEFGAILHGAVAALLLPLMQERQQLGELRGKFGR